MSRLPPEEKQRRTDRARDLAVQLYLCEDQKRNLRALWVLTFRLWLFIWDYYRNVNLKYEKPRYATFKLCIYLFWILLHLRKDPAARVQRWLHVIDSFLDEDRYSRYFIHAVLAQRSPIPPPDATGLSPEEKQAAWQAWDRDRRDPKNFPPDPPWLPKTNFKLDPRNKFIVPSNKTEYTDTHQHNAVFPYLTPLSPPGPKRLLDGPGDRGAGKNSRHLAAPLVGAASEPPLLRSLLSQLFSFSDNNAHLKIPAPRFSEPVRWDIANSIAAVIFPRHWPKKPPERQDSLLPADWSIIPGEDRPGSHFDSSFSHSCIRDHEERIRKTYPDLRTIPISLLDSITPLPRPLFSRSRAPP